jgi:cathepsin B
MWLPILLSFLLLAQAQPPTFSSEDDEVVPHDAIDYINSAQSSWTASKRWVVSMKIHEARKYTGTLTTDEGDAGGDSAGNDGNNGNDGSDGNNGNRLRQLSVPATFNALTRWPGCIHPVLDQGQCGSCWAFGSSEALSDRFCIATAGATNVTLSPQYLVSCDKSSFGCSGGYLSTAWNLMATTGIPTLACVPYKAINTACPTTCSNGSAMVKYYAKSVKSFTTPASIQLEISTNGPVEAGFTVYQDFMGYTSGGHAVKMIGWGVSGSTNYWICQNQWGTSWGMKGFFWIKFGQVGIDSGVYAGLAKV